MYTTQARPRPVHRQFPGGLPLAGLAITAIALFLAGLIASTAMAGKAFPSPSGPAASILACFRAHQDAARVSGFFQFAAARTSPGWPTERRPAKNFHAIGVAQNWRYCAAFTHRKSPSTSSA